MIRFLAALMLLSLESVWSFDSQAFQATPDQLNRVWNIPNCEDVTQESIEKGGHFHGRAQIAWGDFRKKIAVDNQWPANLDPILNEIFSDLLGKAMESGSIELMQDILLQESSVCLFGVVAVLYYYTSYIIQLEDDIDSAFLYHSLMDVFYAGSHPDLLDKGDWGFKSKDVLLMKQIMLKKKFERGLAKNRAEEEDRRQAAVAAISGPRQLWFLDNNLEHVLLSGGGNTRITAKQLLEHGDQDVDAPSHLENPEPYYQILKSENPDDWFVKKKPKGAVYIQRHWDSLRDGIIRQQTNIIENNYIKGTAAVRIYVYDIMKVPVLFNHLAQASNFCGRGQWAAEIHFHEWLLQSQYRVMDPYDADYFFVPGYAICIFEGGFLQLPEIDAAYRKLIAEELWYFRGRERQHVFTFASGMGINVFFSWKEVFPESIFLTPETSLYNDFPHITEAPFNSWKDIAIPGYMHRNEISSLTHMARAVDQKEYTVVFFGRVDPSRGVHPALGGKDVRNEIVRTLEKGKKLIDADDNVKEEENRMILSSYDSIEAYYDPEPAAAKKTIVDELIEFAKSKTGIDNLDRKVETTYDEDVYVGYTSLDNMHKLMGNSKFCFIPRGKSAWSLRLYEAFFADCIPVLLSDYWELPFEDFINYSEIIIRWPMNSVSSKLVDYLRSIPLQIIDRMVAKIHEVRCWFVYPSITAEIHYRSIEENNLPYICRNEQQFANDGILRVLANRNIGGRRTEFEFVSGEQYVPPGRIDPWEVANTSVNVAQTKAPAKPPPADAPSEASDFAEDKKKASEDINLDRKESAKKKRQIEEEEDVIDVEGLMADDDEATQAEERRPEKKPEKPKLVEKKPNEKKTDQEEPEKKKSEEKPSRTERKPDKKLDKKAEEPPDKATKNVAEEDGDQRLSGASLEDPKEDDANAKSGPLSWLFR